MMRRSPTATARKDFETVDRPFAFFAGLLGLSVPFWILGRTMDLEMLPGLPIGALMFLCPAVAASILRWSEGGTRGVRALWMTAIDYRGLRDVRLATAAIFFNPVVFASSFLVGRWLGSNAPNATFSVADVAMLSAVFMVAAVAEELGWSGYALAPMQRRCGALGSSLVLGVVWAAWHWPVLHQAGRGMEWIAWWSLWTILARVIMVWLYNRSGGSVLMVAAYHAASNVSWQLFPENGSHFDPSIAALVTMPVAVVLALSMKGQDAETHRRRARGDTTSCHSETTSCAR